jgi:hypothetical protein
LPQFSAGHVIYTFADEDRGTLGIDHDITVFTQPFPARALGIRFAG